METIDYRKTLSKYKNWDAARMRTYIIEDCIRRYGIIEKKAHYTFISSICINIKKTEKGIKFTKPDINIILF